MLATSSDTLPTGEGWLYEPKWDGYRAIVSVSGGDVTLTSRNGNDLTERFRDVARAAALAIRSSDAVLDGEICALDEQGRSRFSLLQEGSGTPVLVLFDLLELESERLTDLPLSERRKRLESLVDHGGPVCSCRRSSTTGPRYSRRRASRSSKGSSPSEADSPYRPGRRSVDWHKLKLRQTQEVVIAGYTRGQGRRVGVRRARRGGTRRWCAALGGKRRHRLLRP